MILTKDAPLLRKIAEKVDNFGSVELKDLLSQLFQIMEQNDGAGFAAPQIGISKRLFVYGFEFNPRYPDAPPVQKNYVINPEILWQSEEIVDLEEGCLSVPDMRGIVSRPRYITYTAFDIDGKSYEKKASDFEARIILHETDHLNGILFIDKAKSLRNTSQHEGTL